MDHVRYACDIYHGFVGVVFLYREVFEITVSSVSDVSIVVAVELSADTLVDTLSYLVSKISVCIRYDGWCAKLGMCETNICDVRFRRTEWIVAVACVWWIESRLFIFVMWLGVCMYSRPHSWHSHDRGVCDMCYISHDFMHAIFICKRVFDFTVSNVSTVSNLRFSRAELRHTSWHGSASCVQNRAMYTLWWISCVFGYVRNEHRTCSFSWGCVYRIYVLVCLMIALRRWIARLWWIVVFVSSRWLIGWCRFVDLYHLRILCAQQSMWRYLCIAPLSYSPQSSYQK